MVAYPSDLPLPLVADYAVSTVRGVDAVKFERGNRRQRRTAKRERQVFALAFTFSMAQLYEWQTWANAYGYYWHTMNLESPWSGLSASGSALIPHTVRYISDLSIEAITAGYVNVYVQAEMDVSSVPQGILAPSGNWYVAGTPASPAANRVIAGTPSAPATDVIIAGTPASPAA